MAWTAVTNNIDWQAVSFLNEYVGAVLERDAVVSAPGGPGGVLLPSTVVAGQDIQSASGVLKDLQTYITNSGNRWLDPTPADYNGDAAMPTEMTLAQLYTAGGITSGFRRATTIPTDWTDYNDAAFSYGLITAGDIIGPWIFADLQSVLNVMTRTTAVDPDYHTEKPYLGNSGGFSVSPTPFASWALAKAASDTSWASQPDQPTSPTAYAISQGFYSAINGWGATMNRGRSTVEVNGQPSGQDRTVTWYIKPTKSTTATSSVFNANGDKRLGGVTDIVENVLNEMVSDTFTGIAVGNHVSTEKIGTVAESVKAVWAADPQTPGDTWEGWLGLAANIYAIADWDFVYM